MVKNNRHKTCEKGVFCTAKKEIGKIFSKPAKVGRSRKIEIFC